MSLETPRSLNRRDFLAAGIAAASLPLIGRSSALAAPDSLYGPFKFGIQSYSLRGFVNDSGKADVDQALAKTKELGLHYWESYVAHIPVVSEPDRISYYQKKAADSGVRVLGYGVMRFTKNHEENRKLFDFAKKMGIAYMSADPDPDAFDSLDKLVEEYDVAIGIHNHGPGHRYGKIDVIAKTIKDHHEKIGVCNDTGHFLRSEEDPVRAVEVFGKRTYGVHLKDVKDAKHFTVLGKGDLKVVELLKALAKLKYDYTVALEYEENPKNPIDDLKACLAFAQEAIRSI